MKIKSDDTNIFENDKNSIYSKIMDFTFSIKHYLFIYMCIYFILSIGLYYLKAPSIISSILEVIALLILLLVGASTYYTMKNILSVDDIKNQLALKTNNAKKREMTNEYYLKIKDAHHKRTKFDKYWYYLTVLPIICLLSLGWFSFIFTLYIVVICINKHFLDSELEAMERVQNVIQNPNL